MDYYIRITIYSDCRHFAVINVRAVEVDYLFGTAEWPLILVILGSVLMGALIVFSAGIFQVMKLKREIKMLRKENRSAGELTADSDGQNSRAAGRNA